VVPSAIRSAGEGQPRAAAARQATRIRRGLRCTACDTQSTAGPAATAERERSAPRRHGDAPGVMAVRHAQSPRVGSRSRPVQDGLLRSCANSRAVATCVLLLNRVRGGAGCFRPRGCRWYFPSFACPAQSIM